MAALSAVVVSKTNGCFICSCSVKNKWLLYLQLQCQKQMAALSAVVVSKTNGCFIRAGYRRRSGK